MRIALCYYGGLGGWGNKDGRGGLISPAIGFASIQRHVLDANPGAHFDIFVHSWSTEHEREIVDTLGPVTWQIERQRDFAVFAKAAANRATRPKIHDWNEVRPAVSTRIRSLVSRAFVDRLRAHTYQAAFRVMSRFYSSYRVIELKKRYEETHSPYDFVMLLRFDMELDADIRFDTLDRDCFYATHWDCGRDWRGRARMRTNWNFQDYWFIAGTQVMDIFADACFMLPDYSVCAHRASYQHVKRFIGVEKIRYLLLMGRDFELIRRRHGTSTEFTQPVFSLGTPPSTTP